MADEDRRKLAGKNAVVTGGSRGIGKAVAAAYAREGARVFICGRTRSDVESAVEDIRRDGGEIFGMAGDIGKPEDVFRVAQAALKRMGSIEVLVNNASLLGPRVPIADYPFAAWQEVMRVNVDGQFLMTQEVLKAMLPRRVGSIINVNSGVGRVGKARWGAYCPSKFALEGLTQMLAEELRDYRIRVNSLNPGATRTSMRAAAYPEEDPLNLPRPEEITDAFLYLASDDSSNVTGRSLDAQSWRPNR